MLQRYPYYTLGHYILKQSNDFLTDSWGKKELIQMTPTFYNKNSLQVPKMQNPHDNVITKS